MKNNLSIRFIWALTAFILMILAACQSVPKEEKPSILFISSFQDSVDAGLVLISLDPDSLNGEKVQTLGGQPTPSYFDFHPSKKYFYVAASDPVNPNEKGGSVVSYSIDTMKGRMEYINSVPSYCLNPCHVSNDHTGRYIFISSYGSGSLVVYPILENGRLGDSLQLIQFTGQSVNPDRQSKPHAHSSLVSNDNEILYVADLGTDKIMVFEFDESNGKLKPALHPWISCSAGGGPRHMALHPELDILYVAEELSSSISVFNTGKIREDGADAIQRVTTLPSDFTERNSVADIHISPDGKFVYVSNRGHQSIAIFKTDPEDGSLSQVRHQSTLGNSPRSFSLSSDASLLLAANRRTSNITAFRRNPEDGILEETGREFHISKPICIKFVKN